LTYIYGKKYNKIDYSIIINIDNEFVENSDEIDKTILLQITNEFKIPTVKTSRNHKPTPEKIVPLFSENPFLWVFLFLRIIQFIFVVFIFSLKLLFDENIYSDCIIQRPAINSHFKGYDCKCQTSQKFTLWYCSSIPPRG
jgi:hypothetical protein